MIHAESIQFTIPTYPNPFGLSHYYKISKFEAQAQLKIKLDRKINLNFITSIKGSKTNIRSLSG